MTEQSRVEARLRGHFARLLVPPRPEFVPPSGNRRAGWLGPVLAAACVLGMLFVTVIAPGLSGRGLQAGSGQPQASLPDRIARYSYLTGSAESNPPGAAIMLYGHGIGVETMDLPQTLVLGAVRDVYRTIGKPVWYSALSPDGTKVLSGDQPGLSMLDLTTGQYRLVYSGDKLLRPMTWSPDGRLVAAVEPEQMPQAVMRPQSPTAGPPTPAASRVPAWMLSAVGSGGTLNLVDLSNGEARALPFTNVIMAAFSPDGTELVVQNSTDLLVIGLDGAIKRRLSQPAESILMSGAAWSPDGALIVVEQQNPLRLAFVDATGTNQPVPATVIAGRPEVQDAWTGAGTLLTATGNTFVEINVATGQQRAVSTFNDGPASNFHLGQTQFATGLLAGLTYRPAGSPERGPWPLWFRLATLPFIALAARGLWVLGTRSGRKPATDR
jgi:hypothetical protein